MNSKEREDSLTLEILESIEQHDDITQRHLADRLGVALGLANSYLKRCVKKGLIKIHQAPANRYLYYLTPKGFAEKSRLTAEYLSYSFDFYRQAGNSLTHIYKQCHEKGWHRILLCGASELAEIASIRVLENEIELIGIWDPYYSKHRFLHFPVWQNIKDCKKFEAVVLTALNNPDVYYNSLIKEVDKDKVMVPSILRLGKQN